MTKKSDLRSNLLAFSLGVAVGAAFYFGWWLADRMQYFTAWLEVQ